MPQEVGGGESGRKEATQDLDHRVSDSSVRCWMPPVDVLVMVTDSFQRILLLIHGSLCAGAKGAQQQVSYPLRHFLR